MSEEKSQIWFEFYPNDEEIQMLMQISILHKMQSWEENRLRYDQLEVGHSQNWKGTVQRGTYIGNQLQ